MGVLSKVLAGVLVSLSVCTSTFAATTTELDEVIAELNLVVPDLALRVELERTFSRAIIRKDSETAVLTLDPQFLNQLSQTGLLFVVAHEYAHIHQEHHKALGELAMKLTGELDQDSAFDAIEVNPSKMMPLHALNRQHELDADAVAAVWLRQLGVNPCNDDVLSSIDNGGLVFNVVPSHPGFHERRKVICPNMGKPRPFAMLPKAQPDEN